MSKPWEQFTNQQQWKEYIAELLKTNDKALYRSILIIYELQTDEEKYKGETTEHNNIGFGGVDAEFMTSLAIQIKRGQRLSEKQKAIARNKMKKYWKQLMKVSKGEIVVDISHK